MFRFIHTADIHLDSPLKSLAFKDQEASELVANATRQCFTKIIDLCIDEKVDALIIAGDLYDGELRSMKTAEFFSSEMRRLVIAGIKAFIVRGNHDAESRITRELQLPEGVYVFSGHGDSVVLEDKEVVLHGVSFSKPQVPESLLSKYPAKKPGYRNIGLLHTSLAGSTEHDTYAPCSLQDLLDMGYEYWALGHIHKRTVLSQTQCTVVMPGIPQGRHINEAGVKTVTLVTISSSEEIELEERVTSLVQFERLDIDVTEAEEWSEIIAASETAFNKLTEKIETPYAITRVILSGTTSMVGRLLRDTDVLLSELREAARRTGSIFIEQCEINCKISSAKIETSDPVSELSQLMVGQGIDCDRIAADTKKLLSELQKKLPPELRDAFDDSDGTLLKEYLGRGADEILARLEANREDT